MGGPPGETSASSGGEIGEADHCPSELADTGLASAIGPMWECGLRRSSYRPMANVAVIQPGSRVMSLTVTPERARRYPLLEGKVVAPKDIPAW